MGTHQRAALHLQAAPGGEAGTTERHPPPGGRVALVVMIGAWAAVIVKYLSRPIVLSFDTVNNYAHVWFIADQIWHQGRLPFRMPALGHGEAVAFPYGFLPWTTAALVRPLLGDRAVGLWMVLGVVGMVAATFLAFPELRRGWWAAAVLINPAIIQALLFGQLTFAWAAALLLAGIGAWRRDRRVAAVLLVGLAQATHAAVVLPLAALTVAGWLRWERDRKGLLIAYGISLVIAAPAVVMVVLSPTSGDATIRDVVINFLTTVGARCLVVGLPVALVLCQQRVRGLWVVAAALVLPLASNLALYAPLRVYYGATSLNRTSTAPTMQAFLDSRGIEDGATYRVLNNGDAKLGLYRMLQAGGRLDSEFFPESQAIRNFRSAARYRALLCHRKVDYVLAFAAYDKRRHTDEHALLRDLPEAHLVSTNDDLDVFRIDRSACPN